MPEFVAEVHAQLLAVGHEDLVAQLDHLRIVDRCRCGDDFCATFYTRPKPTGAWGPRLETIPLEPDRGMIILDVLDAAIVSVEVLYRDDVKAQLAVACP